MLRSSDSVTQRMAAMALCNLSSNIRNQGFMLDGGLFDPLMGEVRLALDPKSRSDAECIRYCLLILTNLAVNLSNHPLLMKYSLETLSEFSKHRDIKCRQHAVFCLGNLCCNIENLEDVLSSGDLHMKFQCFKSFFSHLHMKFSYYCHQDLFGRLSHTLSLLVTPVQMFNSKQLLLSEEWRPIVYYGYKSLEKVI
jgi:hypothetical protein